MKDKKVTISLHNNIMRFYWRSMIEYFRLLFSGYVHVQSRSYKLLWHSLFYTVICYGFHRYIFKYSHGAFAKDGYQQTPLTWQAGKFVLIAIIMAIIYLNSHFTSRIPRRVVIFYSLLLFIFIVNLSSIIIYGVILTDEIEYLIYSFLLFPLCFVTKEDLQLLAQTIDSIINNVQYILIFSNAIVIFNYFIFRTIPFHAYEGLLMRFGGLWDDPNTFAIFSTLLMYYSLSKNQYILTTCHVIDILLTVSFNGYLLLVSVLFYWILKEKKNRSLYISIITVFTFSLLILVFYNIDYFTTIYEAKQESVGQHSSFTGIIFHPLSVFEPVVFHETWLLSQFVNYFPLSVPFTLIMIILFVRFYFFDRKSLQKVLFILFFITSLSLPFLYMFPINFIGLLFFVLYSKGIRF